jgi:hypothetical protein
LGVDEKALRRAAKVAGLSPEAKEAARATGLDKNHGALLEAAAGTTPAKQVATVYRLADHKRDARRPAQTTNTSLAAALNRSDSTHDDAALIVAAWRGTTTGAKLRVVHELADELREIYWQLVSGDGSEYRKTRRRTPSPASSTTASRSHDPKARQYELDLGEAHHPAGRDGSISLQHAN